MALVRVLGKPTFFLTMTMDIKYKELVDLLHSGQSPYDRPDLICRIFKQKVDALMKEIVQDGILGEHVAHTYMIEFQKRGAPHIHLLIWIKDFIASPENIDQVISAEIPDPRSQPELFEAVATKILHGPCDAEKKYACRQDNNKVCSKKFPRQLNDRTKMDDGCFPSYKRRAPGKGGHVVRKHFHGKTITVDNSWVVPYNPYLLMKYGCHINLEYCHTVSSVKCLFKYT
jgi:hypothetical protein